MKSFIKNNIKFIIVIIICLVGSSITTLATNYLFNSNEVSYDNTNSGLHADYVQGAIDEVFQHATDYSEIKTKIGSDTLTTTSNTLIGSINELNDLITSHQNLGTLNTIQAIGNKFDEQVNTIGNRGRKAIYFVAGSNASPFNNNEAYYGELIKGGSNSYATAIMISANNSIISCSKYGSSWNFETVTLNKNIQYSSGGSGTIRYKKFGRIAMVTVYGATKDTSLQGLPIPADYVKAVMFSGSTIHGYIDYENGWNNHLDTTAVYGSFVYITAS